MKLEKSDWYRSFPRWLILLVLVLLVFGRATQFEFVIWDDGELISGNPHVTGPSPWSAWTGPHLGMYIPVTYNLWWALARLGSWFTGSAAVVSWPYHTANLVVHFLNALLVMRILGQIGLSRSAGLLGSLIFALHPLQVESVAWSTAMKDLLSTCFALSSISCFLAASGRFREQRPTSAHAWYSLSLLTFLLGTLSKPGVFAAPVIALTLDLAFVSGWRRGPLWRFAGMLLIIVPSGLWTRWAQTFPEFEGVGRVFRPTIAGHAIGFYLTKLFVPSSLCIMYGMEPRVVVSNWTHIGTAALSTIPLIGFLVAGKHRKILAVGFIVFVLGVGPVLGLVPFVFQAISTVADRYVYMSMLGVAIAGGYALSLVPRRSTALASIAIVLGLSSLTWKQVSHWSDTLALMGHCIDVNPRASVAYNNFACAACPSVDFEKWIRDKWNSTTKPALPTPEESDELLAISDMYYRIAFGLRPRYTDPLRNMIQNRAVRSQYKEACEIGEYAVRVGPSLGWDPFVNAINPYGLGWLNQQIGNIERAQELYSIAILRERENLEAVSAYAQAIREAESMKSTTRPITAAPITK